MFHQQPYNAQPSFRIIKSFMVESGTYNPMYTRPYYTEADANTINNFLHLTNEGTNVNRYNIASISGQILSPSAQPDAAIQISNGWTTRRIIFMMEIEEVGTSLSTVLSGYADRVDLSLSGLLDPNLEFTINSMITLNRVNIQTPHGIIEQKRVVDNGHIFGTHTLHSLMPLNPNHYGNRFDSQNRVYLQRPSDVAHNLSLGFFEDGVTMDGRTQVLEGDLSKSSRGNNLSSTYIANTVNALRASLHSPEFDHQGFSKNDIYSDAGYKMSDGTVTSNSVMRYFSRNSNIFRLGFVTWEQLTKMFPDLDGATQYFSSVDVPIELTNESHFISSHGNFENWGVTGFESKYATIVLQMLPALMSQNMLTGYSGMFTNDTIDSSYTVTTTDARSFIDGFDRTQSIQNLEDRIRFEVLPALTNGNTRLITVIVNLSLIRDGYISISVDGGYQVEFSAPMWGDGLYVPTITTNPESLSTIAGTVSTLVNYNL